MGLTESIQEFREDIGRELINAGQIPHPEQSKWELNRAIVEAKEEAESTILEDIGIICGIVLILLVPFGIETGVGVQLLGVLLTSILFLRAVTIGTLAFEPPDTRIRPRWHAFMLAWNTGPLQGTFAKIGVPLVGVLMQLHRPGYEGGVWIMRQYARGNL